MTQNILNTVAELYWIFGGSVFLILFAVLLVHKSHSNVKSGSQGHRSEKDPGSHEDVRADGYIDSFLNEVEEGGGGLNLLLKIFIPGVFIAWLLYIILYFQP